MDPKNVNDWPAIIDQDGLLEIPPGSYTLEAPIVVTRPGVSIRGAGGATGHAATKIVAPLGAFVFASAIDFPPYGAIRSRISDVEITSANGAAILRQTSVAVERVSLVGCLIGLHTDGQAPRNANECFAQDVVATSCVEGFRTEGGDANIGHFIACRARYCGVGFYDRSLGNSYMACSSECSIPGQVSWVVVGGTNQSALIGCSSESAVQPKLGHPSRVLGGLWNKSPETPQGQTPASVVSQGPVGPHWSWSQPRAGGGFVQGRLGGGEGQDAWSAWGVDANGVPDLKSLRLYLAGSSSGFWQGRWVLGYGSPVSHYPAMVIARDGQHAGKAQFPDLLLGVQAPESLTAALTDIRARLAALEGK